MIRNRLFTLATIVLVTTLGACSSPPADETEATMAAEETPAFSVEEVPAGSCESNADCGEAEYCMFAVGACEGLGTCEVRPEVCTMDYTPVCGCDGETYSNACNAASAGVSVQAEGECA